MDTIPPKLPVEVMALRNEQVKPFTFIDNLVDATDVRVSFVTEPDTSTPGEKEVKIALEDLGHNITIITSKLTVLGVQSSVQVEAGTALDVKPEDFVDNDNIVIFFISDLSDLIQVSPPFIPYRLRWTEGFKLQYRGCGYNTTNRNSR